MVLRPASSRYQLAQPPLFHTVPAAFALCAEAPSGDEEMCTGVDVLRAVCPKAPRTVFVVLTNHVDPQYRRLCLDTGARWFLDKSTDFRKIKEVIGALAPASE